MRAPDVARRIGPLPAYDVEALADQVERRAAPVDLDEARLARW